jgi:hypothetical protein
MRPSLLSPASLIVVGLVAVLSLACGGDPESPVGPSQTAGAFTPAGTAVTMPMKLVISSEHAALCGQDYTRATATAEIEERAHPTYPTVTFGTRVTIRVFNVKPNHIYTVWLKLDGPSPIVPVMAATPLASTSGLANIIRNTSLIGPTEAATTAIFQDGNAFYTDGNGNGELRVVLDFQLSDDLYPFSRVGPYPDFPLSTNPFALRVISHCQDFVQHGIFSGNRHEPTFDLDLPL